MEYHTHVMTRRNYGFAVIDTIIITGPEYRLDSAGGNGESEYLRKMM